MLQKKISRETEQPLLSMSEDIEPKVCVQE